MLLKYPYYKSLRFFSYVYTHFHSSVSVESSCSRYEKMMTISVMIRGQSEVTWWGDILMRMTRKQRKTALWTAGELGIVRRLSAKRSVISRQ